MTGVTGESSTTDPQGLASPASEALRVPPLSDSTDWIAREEQLRRDLEQALYRAEQLTRALDSNRDIGAAIGILMAQHRITRDRAFDLIRRTSQHSNVKLRDIALDVIETGVLEMRPPAPQIKATPRPPQSRAQALARPNDGHRRLRALIDAVPAMIGYWDRELRNVLANRAYEDWFGMTSEEIHGLHIREVIGEHLYALNLPYLMGALAGETQHFERTIVDARGTTRYSQASYIPDFVHGAEVAGIFVLVADVTTQVMNRLAVGAEPPR